MRSDVLRRVRWGNVARAFAVVAVVGTIVAWPRLTPPAPAVPEREVRPLVEPPARETITRPPTEAELRSPGGGRRRHRAPRRRVRRERDAVRPRRERVVVAPQRERVVAVP